jgi:hypothetical protein
MTKIVRVFTDIAITEEMGEGEDLLKNAVGTLSSTNPDEVRWSYTVIELEPTEPDA